MPPYLKNVEQNATRPCADLVWIVLSCQATQAERPDSLTQSKPNLHTVFTIEVGCMEVVLSKRAGKYQMAASTCNWSFQN